MKLVIVCRTRDKNGKEKIEEIKAQLHDIKLTDFAWFLDLERRLNTITKSRFHIQLEDKK